MILCGMAYLSYEFRAYTMNLPPPMCTGNFHVMEYRHLLVRKTVLSLIK